MRVLEPNHEGDEIFFKDDKFAANTPDTEWISKLAIEKGWIVLSFDYEILRKPIERAAWDEAGLTGFFFDGGWGNLKIEEATWRFFRWWPVIKLQASIVAPGATFVVPRDGATLQQMS